MSKSRPDVSKMTHGSFITINIMILYFKHILYIDDFPLNGHPPSKLECGNDMTICENSTVFAKSDFWSIMRHPAPVSPIYLHS